MGIKRKYFPFPLTDAVESVEISVYDCGAAAVAVKTAGQVAQMLGYNEPEKTENTVVIDFKGDIGKYTK